MTLTFAGQILLMDHGERRGVIIYPNKLCYI